MRRLVPVWFAVALTLLMGSADASAKTNAPAINRPTESAPASSTEPAARTAAAELPSLEQSYRAREAKAGALEAFEGGDVVLIGSSTLILVLLIILIIVLI